MTILGLYDFSSRQSGFSDQIEITNYNCIKVRPSVVLFIFYWSSVTLIKEVGTTDHFEFKFALMIADCNHFQELYFSFSVFQ